MTDRPITFSAPMVLALLEGRKTQTRRLLNPQPIWLPEKVEGFTFGAGWEWGTLSRWKDKPQFREELAQKMRVKVGDRLYVREHWKAREHQDDEAPRDLSPEEPLQYLADGGFRHWPYAMNDFQPGRHRLAMHMPRWASRLTLTVTDVRVQRLQEISEEDAVFEGIEPAALEGYFKDYGSEPMPKLRPAESFQSLWDSLHTEECKRWFANPWIYAVSFDVARGNIDEIDR